MFRELVGCLRDDTTAQLELLNQIWELDAVFTNYLLPQQKLLAKVRRGAKVSKTHDAPATPHRRAEPTPLPPRAETSLQHPAEHTELPNTLRRLGHDLTQPS